MRTSKRDLHAIFETFCRASGQPMARAYNDVGGLRLDYNSVYGGYVMEKIINASGAVTRPYGDYRRQAGEMYDTLHFAVQCLLEVKRCI